MAPGGQSRFVQRIAAATERVAAITNLLEQVAGMFYQLVHVAGWLVLLYGSIALLVQPHPSLEHLVAPGAGVAAVLQGRLAAWLSRRIQTAASLPSGPSGGVGGVEGGADVMEGGAGTKRRRWPR